MVMVVGYYLQENDVLALSVLGNLIDESNLQLCGSVPYGSVI